jgi:DNA (cytosine-5)-methyltransferase 1
MMKSLRKSDSPKPTFIDLFAGAGGLSEGFIRAGFEPAAHVEMDKAACFTLRTRVAYQYFKDSNNIETYIDYLKGEISRDELYSMLPDGLLNSVINLPIGPENNEVIFKTIDRNLKKRKVDLIIGGPPCQAYSLAGRSRVGASIQNDARNYLFKEYAKYLEKYNPKMFVFENVFGLLSAGNGKYLEEMKSLFLDKGYLMQVYKVEANNFGVLQNRKRLIILGIQKKLKLELPDLESIQVPTNARVAEIFKDLPPLQAGDGVDKNGKYQGKKSEYLETSHIRNGINVLTQHISRPHNKQDQEIYKIAVNKWDKNSERLNYNDLHDSLKTHKNRHSFTDRFKVVAADLPHSQTVVAHIAKDGHYYIHPDIEQNRSISVREAARLQSFPDDFYFEGEREGASRTSAFKQIGNAVPPLMAEKIAEKISEVI